MIEEEIYEKIKKYDTIVIFGHVLPDGDCYGSEIGLKDAIKSTFNDKKVYAVGSGLPRLFSRYGEMDVVSNEVISNSLAIALDVANFERIEDQRFNLARDIIKIDHHLFANAYGSIEWIDNSAASCSQMLANFVMKMGMKISPLGAEALLLGLITDSGRFQFSSTSENSFEVASFLLKCGASLKDLYDILYVVEAKDLRYKAYAYQNFVLDGGVSYLVIPFEDSKKYEVSPDYAASQVNLLANIKGYPIWATFAEREDGTVRVELRSSSVSVQPIAVKYNGGGHKQASGCKLEKLSDYKNVVEDLKIAAKEQ